MRQGEHSKWYRSRLTLLRLRLRRGSRHTQTQSWSQGVEVDILERLCGQPVPKQKLRTSSASREGQVRVPDDSDDCLVEARKNGEKEIEIEYDDGQLTAGVPKTVSRC